MKKILLISYLYPPVTSSQAEHVKNLGDYLSKYYDVTILTTNWSGNVDTIQLNENLRVCSTSFGALHKLKNNDVKVQNKKRKKGIKSKIIAYLKGRIIPDPTFDWYPIAKRWLKNNIYEYDVILSIATPYTDLIIGNKFLQMNKSKNDIKFIVCYADPWYGEISRKRGAIRQLIEKKIESSILKNADNILMVTKNAMKYYKELFPEYAQKIDYYYIGHNINLKNTKKYEEDNIYRLRYFGALQSVHRNPFEFLEVLNNPQYIGKVKFELYLIPDPSHEKIFEVVSVSSVLKEIVEFKTPVSYEKMLEIASLPNSCNILFGNTSNLQIPVKLFDYIGVKSKILYVENNYNEEISMILNEYKNYVMCNNTKSSIEEALNRIINSEKNMNVINNDNIGYIKTSCEHNFNIYRKLIGN